jgi:hypothetical protein
MISTPSPLSPTMSWGWEGAPWPQGMVVPVRVCERKALESFMNLSIRERRQDTDRRRAPTSLMGTLRVYGRRGSGRRAGEGGTYVDRLSPHVVTLVLFVVCCSALDALLTLMHIQQGGYEANPVMAMAMNQGTGSFIAAKMALTGLGAILLAIHQNFWLGIHGLYALALIYAGLLVYHLIIYSSGT